MDFLDLKVEYSESDPEKALIRHLYPSLMEWGQLLLHGASWTSAHREQVAQG